MGGLAIRTPGLAHTVAQHQSLPARVHTDARWRESCRTRHTAILCVAARHPACRPHTLLVGWSSLVLGVPGTARHTGWWCGLVCTIPWRAAEPSARWQHRLLHTCRGPGSNRGPSDLDVDPGPDLDLDVGHYQTNSEIASRIRLSPPLGVDVLRCVHCIGFLWMLHGRFLPFR